MLTTQVSFLKITCFPFFIPLYCYILLLFFTIINHYMLPTSPHFSGRIRPRPRLKTFQGSIPAQDLVTLPERPRTVSKSGKIVGNSAKILREWVRSGKLWKSWKNLGRCRKICVPESWNSFQIWGSITLFGPRTWPKSYRMVKTKRRWCQLAKNPDFIKNHPMVNISIIYVLHQLRVFSQQKKIDQVIGSI